MKRYALILFLCSSSSFAYILNSAQGKSEFKAIGRPAAIKIVGQGAGPAGDVSLKLEKEEYVLSGEVNLDLETLDTGISMRDQHMKEKYLEVGKAKTATLKFQDIKIPKAVLEKGGELKVSGLLNLHKVDKPVELSLNLKKEGHNFNVVSQFQIKLSDYSVEIPSYAGITVADLVDIKIETLIGEDILAQKKETQ